MQTHICLIYNTAISNLSPALDSEHKPQQAILVHPISHQQAAQDIAAVMTSNGIQVSYCVINDAYDVAQIRETLLELVVANEEQQLVLNASGGTRPMSMAAYEVFRELELPIFYVNPTTDQLTWLHRHDLPSRNIADRLKLPAYLRAHGTQLESQAARDGVPKALRELTAMLVQHAERLAAPLAALNWLAQQAERSLRSPALTRRQLQWDELVALISAFAEQGVLDIERDCLQFKDEASRFFVNGGWLETHTYSELFNLRSEIREIQDIGRSVEVIRQKNVRNELDVVFLANNRCYIIECKTKRFTKTDTNAPSADVLYKLDSLQNTLGGSRSEVMLVSYHPISAWDRQRAKDLQVALCTANQLGQLKSHFAQWIRSTGGENPADD